MLRALVLLLALLVPGAPAQAHPAPTPGVCAESFDQDLPDTAVRPPAGAAQLTEAAPRPAPRSRRTPVRRPAARPRPATTGVPGSAPLLRTVVLRC